MKKNLNNNEDVNNLDRTDADLRNLNYDSEKNSFELDVTPDKIEDRDYQHPDPYDTAAENGEDFNSDYDESNPFVGDEYDKDASLEKDVDTLGMHISDEEDLRVGRSERMDAITPEDFRDDLDQEGYPKNDRKR